MEAMQMANNGSTKSFVALKASIVMAQAEGVDAGVIEVSDHTHTTTPHTTHQPQPHTHTTHTEASPKARGRPKDTGPKQTQTHTVEVVGGIGWGRPE